MARNCNKKQQKQDQSNVNKKPIMIVVFFINSIENNEIQNFFDENINKTISTLTPKMHTYTILRSVDSL